MNGLSPDASAEPIRYRGSYTFPKENAVKTLVLAFVALLPGVIASACASAGDGPNTSATSRAIETPEQAYWGGVLGQLRIESSEFATQALQAWARVENTKAQWNPLATTLKKPGSSDFNSAGVKNYPDQATGIKATADTLLYTPSGSGSYYRAIREMLSRESFNRQELQGALNKWSGNGPYVPGLLDQWAALWSEQVTKPETVTSTGPATPSAPATPAPRLPTSPTPSGQAAAPTRTAVSQSSKAWARSYGGVERITSVGGIILESTRTEVHSMQQTSDGGYILSGAHARTEPGRFGFLHGLWLLKVNASRVLKNHS